jgi:hypothetical protein
LAHIRIATKKEFQSRRRVIQTIKALPIGIMPSTVPIVADQSATRKLLGESY